MKKTEKILRDAFAKADIEVGGSRPQDIQVHDPVFYDRVLRDGFLGLGESYMDGQWNANALDEFIRFSILGKMEDIIKHSWTNLLLIAKSRIFNLQNLRRAFHVGERHYDIGNDLYTKMLGKRMQYTCGYWKKAKTLDEAQEAKLDLVCKKLKLKKGMSILELGCGWGGFAKYAAERYGARVTAVTVSKEQVKYGQKNCKGLPVDIRLQDYRTVEGEYDRVVSIGIMEHVGYKNYRSYMELAARRLKPDGIAFVHTIGSNVSMTTANAWIHKYIFPNGMIPSIRQLGSAMEGVFVMEDWHNFGPDYDKTLMAWYKNFVNAWPKLKRKYGERFYKMWEFYLLISAGAFRARDLQLWQIVMTHPGTKQPLCRVS